MFSTKQVFERVSYFISRWWMISAAVSESSRSDSTLLHIISRTLMTSVLHERVPNHPSQWEQKTKQISTIVCFYWWVQMPLNRVLLHQKDLFLYIISVCWNVGAFLQYLSGCTNSVMWKQVQVEFCHAHAHYRSNVRKNTLLGQPLNQVTWIYGLAS
jgi:hypothetical protein